MKANRCWVATCQYPGKEPFRLGTVVADSKASEMDVHAEFKKLWEKLSPHPMPPITTIVPGSLFFVPEELDNE